MKGYKPPLPFNVAMKILKPTKNESYGVSTKVYPNVEEVNDDMLFFGSFRTFGGTETTVNGVYTLLNTAVIDTWFRDDIKPDCRIYVCETGDVYEVMGEPENIGLEFTYLQFKVKKVGGNA